MDGFRVSVLDELTPGEVALLEQFRALPVDQRRALLKALEQAAADARAGAPPLAFLANSEERSGAAVGVVAGS